jgi:hypothetical protein
MQFSIRHKYHKTGSVFSEEDAPDWLTGVNTVRGSTMDCRWFWTDHVLTLEVGKSVDTDFHTITRLV